MHMTSDSCAHTSTEIMVADDLSKNFDSSTNYKLSQGDFQMLCQSFGPFCLDLFTSPFSHLFKPFCSRYMCKDTATVDVFTVDWSKLANGFFHPPVGLVTRAAKYIFWLATLVKNGCRNV